MRRDLPLGLMAAQITHAAGESSDKLPAGTYAVVLAAPDAAALEALSARLDAAGVRHTVIRENDPPYCGEATAIGVEPAPRSVLKRHFSSLPLLRGE